MMMKIFNPANGELLGELEVEQPETLRKRFDNAAAAQRSWAAIPVGERIAILARFRDLLRSDQQRLASILTSEVGKPITQSKNEINGAIGRIDFFLENVSGVMEEQDVTPPAEGAKTAPVSDEGAKAAPVSEWIRQEPLGVIANISAWNYPYLVGVNVFVPALLTGNAVLYKPSEFAPYTGLAIAEALHRSGVPKPVFAALIGGAEVGQELLRLPVNGVFFTGSHATGKRIAETVASRLIRVQLELGGKDPVYVCDDVEVRAAAESLADGAFYNCGQSCCSVERIYVHEKIYEPFVSAFLETVKGFVIGDPTDEKTYLGPLTRAAQLQVLESQVADAQSKGAKLLYGGKRIPRPGHYFEPTILTEVNHAMSVMKDESFGPVIGIQKVAGDEEALSLMRDTEYGLTAGVYSTDRARAQSILSRVNAGSVYWNCCDRVSPRLPWSGRGHSGIGSTLSTYGIQAFLQPKAWHMKGPP